MTDEKIQILPQDLEANKTIKEILLLHYSSTLIVFPGMKIRPEEYKRATLVIALGNFDKAQTLTVEKDLPEHTPILFLGTEDRLPSACVGNTTARLVDYLRVPVSKEIFLHKVSLLTQVRRITMTFSQQLNQLNDCDCLTGLYNRRHLTSRLSEIFFSTRESEKELSVLIINIDDFGDVSTLLGLEFSDYILNQLSVRLTRTIRDIDMWYRFSDGEFIVILPEADLQFAMATAQKIHEACAGCPFSDGNHTTSIAISIGIASLRAHLPENPNKLIFMAEKALFEAKAGGSNRIRTYTHKDIENNLPQLSPLAFLQDKLGRIHNKSKSSVLSSLENLAGIVAGSEHKRQIASVAHYISLLCSHFGIPAKHIQTFHNSVTLYNCFRALLHNDMLAKPDKLTWGERKIMENLPCKLAELADMLVYFGDEKSLLLSFNERYDGTGFPDGLEGDEIPLGARLFHIVDAVAAMNADRPFRKKHLPKEIIKELKQGAGRQFDPFLVLQFLTVIEQNGLIEIDPGFLIQTRQDILNSFTQHRP
ncbi:MAG: diguanylate cyclase [Desulfobulbaceae bacterium]|nr:diguanylate cyclase [Desulfobulbaceae bacterium]